MFSIINKVFRFSDIERHYGAVVPLRVLYGPCAECSMEYFYMKTIVAANRAYRRVEELTTTLNMCTKYLLCY